MDDGSDRPKPVGQRADSARQERLAQALRANLKRRKAQIRGRTAEPNAEMPRDGEHESRS